MTYIGKMAINAQICPSKGGVTRKVILGAMTTVSLSVTDPETAGTCKKGAIEWGRRAGYFA
jgi:hypothetical protein